MTNETNPEPQTETQPLIAKPVKKIIARTNIKWEAGYMYFVTFDKDKNLLIGKTLLSRKGRPRIIREEKKDGHQKTD
jgi:hypothetical protein